MSEGAPSQPAIVVEDRSAVRWVFLNRPARLNAMDTEILAGLPVALEEAAEDPSVRVVVVSGKGRAFCAGGDLDVFAGRNHDEATSMGYQRASVLLREMPKPTIAAVNGVVAGGGFGIATAADLRIAAASARFTAGFGAIGVAGDYGGSFHLPRLVGPERALRFYLLNETWDAETALARGLVSQVAPDAMFEQEVTAVAERLAASAPLALARMKATFHAGESASLEEVLRLEVRVMLELSGTDDFAEGIAAFKERRPPVFGGS